MDETRSLLLYKSSVIFTRDHNNKNGRRINKKILLDGKGGERREEGGVETIRNTFDKLRMFTLQPNYRPLTYIWRA